LNQLPVGLRKNQVASPITTDGTRIQTVLWLTSAHTA